jgi:hypothetical protein
MSQRNQIRLTPFHLPPYPDVIRASSILLQALGEAQDNGQLAWEYAVELRNFCDARVPTCVLRWLMDKGIAEHGYEQASDRSGRRRFRLVKSHEFKENSCFVLKTEMAAEIRKALSEAALSQFRSEGAADPLEQPVHFGIPYWNSQAGEIWYENDLVKKLSGTALNQRSVMDAGQKNDWRQPIPSPFKVGERFDSETLHNTLASFNRNQINPRLHLFRDGTGKAFRWEPLHPGPH